MTESNSTAGKVAQLRRTLLGVRSHARRVWWGTTILGVLGALALALLLAVFLDQMLAGLPAAIRLVLLLGIIAAPALVIWQSLRTRPGGTPEDLALLVEQHYPELDNVLINTLQLAGGDGAGASGADIAPIIDAVAGEAQSKIDSIRPYKAIHKKALATAASAFALGFVVLMTYAVLNSAALATALNRVLSPLGRNTLTRIVSVTPGDTDVLINSEVSVEATLAGRVPTRADLICDYTDGRRVVAPMVAPSLSVPDRLEGKIRNLEQNVKYTVVAGDDRSQAYALRVHQRPGVQQIVQTITLPEYIQSKPTEATGGEVQALVGSKVLLKIEATEPIKAGKVTFGDGRVEPLKLLPRAAGIEGSTGGTVELSVKQAGKYEVSLTSSVGFDNEPASYNIVALEDKMPVAEFTKPAAEISVDIADKVLVEVRASDDYAVRDVKLMRIPADAASAENKLTAAVQLADWPVKTRDQARVTRQQTIDVAALGLSEKTPIVLQAQAYDYRPDAPAGVSGLITIRLKTTATDDARKQPQLVRVSLDALIAKQRLNIAASEIIQKGEGKAADMPRLTARQEEIRKDALTLSASFPSPSGVPAAPGRGQGEGLASSAPSPSPDQSPKSQVPSPSASPATQPTADNDEVGVKRTLANLADTLMVVAIEQLRGSAAQTDPRPTLPKAIDTEKAILSALVVANARQDAELAARRQREISEQLAQLITRQQALRTDTDDKKEVAAALSSRQSVQAREASRIQKLVEEEASSGAGGNPDLVAQYEKVSTEFKQRAVRANMLIAAELLASDTRPQADAKEDQVIKDLQAIQKILLTPALASAKDEVKDAAEGIKQAKEKVDKLAKLQQAITEIAKQLHKTEDLSDGKGIDPEKVKDLVAERKNLADAVEQLVKDMHLMADMSASNDILSELSEVYEKVKQAAGSENTPASEVAVSRDEGTLAALKAMQKKMGERIGDLEMWLAHAPDSVAWKQESWDKAEIGKVPLGDLQDKLEDIIGDLLDKSKEMEKKSQDSVSNVGLPDGEMGWDIADGPMPSWAAKGKSGNDKPNDNEQTGRSGSGRQGKSSGEIVGDTLKGLKGAELEARRTNDGFQAGELKEEDPGKMDVKATGGGKLAGTSDSEGMNGDAPARNELKYRGMKRQAAELKHDAETVYSKARLMKLPTGQLDRAILEMDAAQRRLDSGDAEGFAKAQQQVVRALQQTKSQFTGKAFVETTAHDGPEQKIAGATNEPVPKQYEDTVAEYMRKIAEEK